MSPEPTHELEQRIDAALIRVAKATGADDKAVRVSLSEVRASDGAWTYLTQQATPAVRSLLVDDSLRSRLRGSWGLALLDGSLGKQLEAEYTVETEEEADDDPAALVLEHYPDEAHECLRQENFVGGYDADVIALWRRADRTSVCHAHPEGFWLLGDDPADWMEKIASEVEENA